MHVTGRVCVPPPHVAEHALKFPVCHAYVAHACVLHVWELAGRGPAEAHNVSDTTAPLPCSMHVTGRVCVPPPHVAEQALKVPVCHAYVAHACVLHA